MSCEIVLCPLPSSGEAFLHPVLRDTLAMPKYQMFWPGREDEPLPVAAKWLFLVRDLRDIVPLFARSLLDAGQPTVPAGYTIDDALEMVISHALRLPLTAQRNLAKVHGGVELHFEDLCTAPTAVIANVLSKLSINFDPEKLASAVATHRFQLDRIIQHATPRGSFNTNSASLFRIFLGTEQLALGYRLEDLPAAPTPVDRRLDFFTSRRRPYYIWAHGYRQSSAGIRGLHYLCHALNEMGEEAYITPAPVLNPSLRTPRLTLDTIRRHFLAGRHPVMLYPEVVSGNPYAAPIVARWLLNRPGHIGGDTHFSNDDLLFHFARWCIPEGCQNSLILNLPTVDTTIFNNDDNPFNGQRAGACYYANKYLAAGGTIAADIENSALSLGQEKPRTPEELAEIFRQSEVLYCYELSSLIPEALSCGCPVLIVPSAYWQRHGDPGIFSGKGIELASTPGALAKAKSDVVKFRCSDDDTANYYWWQIERFIAKTQAAALPVFGQQGHTPESGLWMLEKKERRAHLAALDKLYQPIISSEKDRVAIRFSPPVLSDIELALIAERLQHPVRIELIVVADEANRSMLSATLSSIVAQQYPGLSVTVVAPVSLADKYPHPYIHWQCAPRDQWSPACQALQESCAEWCGIVRSGDLIVSGALALFACQAEATPLVRVLYSDECAQENADSECPPTFRSAFDIDLVRNGACTFGLLLAHRDAWAVAGGWRANYCGLDTQDALLRLWEACGDAGIGHIAGAVYLRHRNNRPFLPNHPEIAEARRQIVREHLSRSRTSAEVIPDQTGQREHIGYRSDKLPKVSLIIITKDNRVGLEACIRSILDLTDYPDLEILVIDNGSTETSARTYLDNLAASQGDTIQVAVFNQPFNLGAIQNAAVQLAKGELLLFMHDDTEVLSHGWLRALATHCLRPGVAMAGALLVTNDGTVQEAGIVAMQFGITANPLAGKSPESEDSTGLLHGARQVSAISSACMMVRRDAFIELGGMDAANFPARAADIDFCLRLRDAGYRIIWTPDAIILHDSDGSMRGNKHDNNVLLAKWGGFLTDDPYFNPWLALGSQEYAPETDPAFQPDPIAWHPLPNVYGAQISGGKTEQQRIEQVIRCATESGLIRGRVGRALPPPVQLKRLAIDVIHCCAPLTAHEAREIEKYRQLLGCRLVLDLDTLVESVPDTVDPVQYIFHALQQYEALIDRFTTSSHWLAGELSEWSGQVVVVTDGIDPARWNHPRSYRDGDKLRVGWHGRPEDLEGLVPVIMALANEVDWIFIGTGPQVLAPCIREQHYLSNVDDLPAKLASLDLDLAIGPLAMTAQNKCRSHLTILQYGALGIPVVATDIDAYRTGLPITLTGNTIRGWTESIRAYAGDRAACRQKGEALREHVLAHRTLAGTMAQWQQAWQPAGCEASTSRTSLMPAEISLPRAVPTATAGRQPGSPREEATAFESAYQQWLTARHDNTADAGSILEAGATPMAGRFHVILRHSGEDTAPLAETLDGLGRQHYRHWHLDIVTPLAAPPGIEEVEAVGWHCLNDGNEKRLIDALVEERACDWVVEIPGGAVLDPLCLWRLAREAALQPEISAFFVDDDVHDDSGARQHPRFKPGVNREWLQRTDLAGPLFVRREAWIGCGGAATRSGSPWFDQMVRFGNGLGWKSLAHVPDVLIGYPETFPTDIKSCLLSLVGNLQARGIGGEIVPATGRTWKIRYPLPAAPTVTVAIPLQGQADLLAR